MQGGNARLGAIVWWDRSALGKVAVVLLVAWTALAGVAAATQSDPGALLGNLVSVSFVAAAWCGGAIAVRRLRGAAPGRPAHVHVTTRATLGR
jgi:hypothetical protein